MNGKEENENNKHQSRAFARAGAAAAAVCLVCAAFALFWPRGGEPEVETSVTAEHSGGRAERNEGERAADALPKRADSPVRITGEPRSDASAVLPKNGGAKPAADAKQQVKPNAFKAAKEASGETREEQKKETEKKEFGGGAVKAPEAAVNIKNNGGAEPPKPAADVKSAVGARLDENFAPVKTPAAVTSAPIKAAGGGRSRRAAGAQAASEPRETAEPESGTAAPSAVETEQPIYADATNPSNSMAVASPTLSQSKRAADNDIYSGNPEQLMIIGSFSDLCVGQNIASIFSPPFGRAIRLRFDEGYITLKDDKTTAAGFSITGLDTKSAKEQGTANASFIYGSKPYSLDISYSVKQWRLSIRNFSGATVVSGLTPDENLKVNLTRYYSAFKRQNDAFCGWSDGGDEVYTTEYIMTSPDRILYPCLAMTPPDPADVGEEYAISGATNVDLSTFGVYESCKKLVIGSDVRYIDARELAKCFPNLESIEAAADNAVYSSCDGILYRGGELIGVPPKKTSFGAFAEGTSSIVEKAFEGVEAENVSLPESVGEIKSGAFKNAHIGMLTIGGECEIASDAFYSDTERPAAEKIVFSSGSVPSFVGGELSFGAALPKICVPDSYHDRAYQYYLSSMGAEIDREFGAGTANGIMVTDTGAENRNSLINGAVYSFFTSSEELTLASVNQDSAGEFRCEPNTVCIAENAFYGCDGITSLVIGPGIKTLESGCFNGLSRLGSIRIESAPPRLDGDVFAGIESDISGLKVYIPAESYADYMDTWGAELNSVYGAETAASVLEADSGFETIGGAQYVRDENGLILVRLLSDAPGEFTPAEGTYRINDGAINRPIDCLIIPETVTEIGENAVGANAGVKHVFVNSENQLNLSAFDSSYMYIPLSMSGEYPGAEAAAERYEPDENGMIIGGGALMYVPRSCSGTLTLGGDITRICAGAAEGCSHITDVAFNDEITVIEDSAFRNCVSLGSVTLPAKLETIGANAFEGCDSISTVTLGGSGLKSIGREAFYACNALTGFNSLDSVNLGGLPELRDIGEYAFSACSLIKKASLSDAETEPAAGIFSDCLNLGSVESWGGARVIGENAFRNTALRSVDFSDCAVEEIRGGAFADCGRLDVMLVGGSVSKIDPEFAEDGARIILAFNGTTALTPEGVAALTENNSVYDTAYVSADNADSFSELFGENTVSHDGEYVCSAASGGLYCLSDGEYSFVKAGTKTVDFNMMSAKVTSIDVGAFGGCDSLETVVLNRTIDKIPAYLFDGLKKLKSFDFKAVSGGASNSDIKIEEYAFRNCSALESAYLASYIGDVGEGAFSGCSSLKTLYWGAAGERIADRAFEGCGSLTNVSINTNSLESLKEIGDRSFSGCGMLSRFMGMSSMLFNNLESIGSGAFENCKKLEDLKLPYSIVRLGDRCFEGCENLQSIRVYSDPFELGSFVFGEEPGDEYFDLGEADADEYDVYYSFWQPYLDRDYGAGAAKKMIYSSKLSDEGGDIGVDDEDDDRVDGNQVFDSTEEPAGDDVSGVDKALPKPTEKPAAEPAAEPTEAPSEIPSEEPVDEPSEAPSEEPIEEPVDEPSEEPTEEPVDEPSEEPTEEPVDEPSEEATEEPVDEPSEEPAEEPAEESVEKAET